MSRPASAPLRSSAVASRAAFIDRPNIPSVGRQRPRTSPRVFEQHQNIKLSKCTELSRSKSREICQLCLIWRSRPFSAFVLPCLASGVHFLGIDLNRWWLPSLSVVDLPEVPVFLRQITQWSTNPSTCWKGAE